MLEFEAANASSNPIANTIVDGRNIEEVAVFIIAISQVIPASKRRPKFGAIPFQ